MKQMRLIDADELENEVIKRAFEGKLEWSVNELKQLIRKQRTPDMVKKFMDSVDMKISEAQERWKDGRW